MISYNRKSIRLKDYDYSSNGAYFVTICTQDREMLFGSVGVDPRVDPVNPCMQLNDVGKMVGDWWLKIADKYPGIELDVYQIMPNHIHGIVIINGWTHHSIGRTHRSAPTIGTIIQWFKTMATNEYIKNVKQSHWPPFNKRVWQRNYFEHIIRNDIELNKIREYIVNNPQTWDRDRNNPNESGKINS
ncbi:transposase [Candidatus Daviesbacteria bacterium]|nr:transposase [Candidatus Daviesbacteria bacterium]